MEQRAEHTTKGNQGFTGKHWVLIAAGVVLFVLLLLAPRTVLNTRNAAAANRDGAEPAKTETAPTSLLAQLPALPSTTEGQVATRLTGQLAQAPDNAIRTDVLNRLVAACINLRRYDYAAVYQEDLHSAQPTPAHLQRTAELYRQAAELPPVLENEKLQRQFVAKALTYTTQVAKANPLDTDAQAELAILHVKAGDQSTVMDGVRALRQVVEQNPAHLRAGLQLGIFSLQTGQYDKAEQRLRTVLVHHPNEALAHYYLGLSLRGQQKQAEATAALKAALRLTQDPALIDRIQAELKK